MTDTSRERPVVFHETAPKLDEPLLVAMLSGWIDASGAAAAALAAVEQGTGARPLATFDGDVFIDYRARRPTMELREGVNERLVWPEIVLKVGADAAGRDVLVLTGPEPDAAWRRFGALVADIAVEFGVRRAVFLGAYPFASPHTRPARLSSSSPSAELIASVPFLKNSVDVPAGMGAVLEHALCDRGIPALGIWAQVPHYLGTMSYPTASVALLQGLAEVGSISIDAGPLRTEATIQLERIEQLVAGNAEHQQMVGQLEALYDQATQAALDGTPLADVAMPSADELAAEFEQFLRDQAD